jgi:hypothetical protein
MQSKNISSNPSITLTFQMVDTVLITFMHNCTMSSTQSLQYLPEPKRDTQKVEEASAFKTEEKTYNPT